METVPSRDTKNWYTHYSEVKIKGLLKYKLILLNYYFIFVTTSYIRWTMYSGNFNLIPFHKYLLQGRLIIFIKLFTFSYRLFLPRLLKRARRHYIFF